MSEVVGWGLEGIQESVTESIKRDAINEAQHEAGREYANGVSAAQHSARVAVDQAVRPESAGTSTRPQNLLPKAAQAEGC
ncbi:hypothetical protein ACFC0M_28140 [Streptomyces sp. NPDC056149]|uniref:hypothetical protein n=1 Tax=Streptomyces sp. NPDC056149 TaxID=3345728 RepID=UPI0035DC086A